jgi:hypothetical protein
MKILSFTILFSVLSNILIAQLSDCSLSPGNFITYVAKNGNTTYIYEEAVNTNLRPPHILSQKRYRYLPPFTVSKVDILPNSDASKAFVRAEFSALVPDKDELLEYIKANGNPRVNANNLEAVCLEGYSLRYFLVLMSILK